jgi:hypothetical protein
VRRPAIGPTQPYPDRRHHEPGPDAGGQPPGSGRPRGVHDGRHVERLSLGRQWDRLLLGRRDGPFEPAQAIEQRQRFVRARAALDGGCQEAPGGRAVATAERLDAAVQDLFTLALALCDRAPRAFHVGTRPRVSVIEEEDARPDADCALVLTGKVVIESGEEEMLDASLAIPFLKIGR